MEYRALEEFSKCKEEFNESTTYKSLTMLGLKISTYTSLYLFFIGIVFFVLAYINMSMYNVSLKDMDILTYTDTDTLSVILIISVLFIILIIAYMFISILIIFPFSIRAELELINYDLKTDKTFKKNNIFKIIKFWLILVAIGTVFGIVLNLINISLSEELNIVSDLIINIASIFISIYSILLYTFLYTGQNEESKFYNFVQNENFNDLFKRHWKYFVLSGLAIYLIMFGYLLISILAGFVVIFLLNFIMGDSKFLQILFASIFIILICSYIVGLLSLYYTKAYLYIIEKYELKKDEPEAEVIDAPSQA